MNWDAIGAIGQVLGSIAVFITLIYLSIQTSHARREARRALSQARWESNRANNAMFLNETVSSAWLKTKDALAMKASPPFTALIEQAKLTPREALSAVTMASAYWHSIYQTMAHIDDLTPVERRQYETNIRTHYGPNGSFNRVYYETTIKPNAHPDAVRFIDAVLAQPS